MSDKDQNELNRGRQASDLLNNPIYQEAFVVIKANLMTEFQKTKFRESKKRDEVWRKMQTVDWMEKHIKSVVNSGRIAELNIADKSRNKIRGI